MPRIVPTRRIAVTGLGLVCSAGAGPDDHARHVLESRGGIRPIRRFPTDGLKTAFGGEIADDVPLPLVPADEAAAMPSRSGRFALSAARQALAEADLAAGHRLGLVAGVCASGESRGEADCLSAEYPQHTLADALARRLGLDGPRATISTACASSGSAIGYAFEWLQAGRVDAVLVGGADELLLNTLAGFSALGALAPEPCSPFSAGLGVTFGEAAVFFLLEPYEIAVARGADVLGEILGYALTGDAYHFTKPHPAGEGLQRAVVRALQRSGVSPADVGYVNAHGTGTSDNDSSETIAARELFGGAAIPPMSSTKSFYGHTLGPACLLELATSLLAVNRGVLPPTLQFTTSRPGCDLDYVPNVARPAEVDVFLSNSAAFGGVNASVVAARRGAGPYPAPEREVDDLVITGVGVVSPIGHGFDAFRHALLAGRSPFAPYAAKLPARDAKPGDAPLAAQVRDFKPRSLVPTLDLRRAEPIAQFALAAAGLTLKHAGLAAGSTIPAERIGIVLAVTRGPVAAQERFRERMNRNGPGGLGAQDFPPMVISTITGQAAEAFQIRGVNSTLVEGTTAGLHGLAHAADILQADAGLDAVLVLAADELGPLSLKIEADAGRLSPTAEGVRPYDETSSGSIPGEGAVGLLIERADAAARRKARPLATIAGTGLAAAAVPRDLSPALQRAAEAALAEAGISVDDIHLVVGSGRGLAGYDAAEAAALARLLASRREPCPTTSATRRTGVSEAASGLYAVATALAAMEQGAAPPLGETVPPPRGALEWVGPGPRAGRFDGVLVVGGTDAGNCAAVVIQRAGDQS